MADDSCVSPASLFYEITFISAHSPHFIIAFLVRTFFESTLLVARLLLFVLLFSRFPLEYFRGSKDFTMKILSMLVISVSIGRIPVRESLADEVYGFVSGA